MYIHIYVYMFIFIIIFIFIYTHCIMSIYSRFMYIYTTNQVS